MVQTEGTVALDAVAAVSERTVTHESGRKTVLVFHGPKTQDTPKAVGKGVRIKHPKASEVLIVNIVNLKAMGGMWKKVATAQINQTYQKMADKIGDGAEEYVIMVTDWDNTIGPSFGVENSDKMPAIVVLGPDGAILGAHEGKDDLVEAALAALE